MGCIVVMPPRTGAAFIPSGMNKSGSYAVTTSYADVTGWAADTTGYPGSTLSGNGVVAQRSKTGATISSSASVNNSSFSAAYTCTLQLMVNGVVAITGTATSIPINSNATATVSGTVNININDVVTLQAVANVSGSVSVTATATYVRIT